MRSSIIICALALVGCGGGGGGGGVAASTSAPLTSATPSPTTTAPPAAPAATPAPVVSMMIIDDTLVPSAPSSAAWYFRTDDPSTTENEAARDIALAIADARNGLSESFVYESLTHGGPLAIFVGGLNHEQDTPARRSGWIVSFAPHVYRALGMPALQVDYKDAASGTGIGALDLALYNASFHEGVLRTSGLFEKALSAGAGRIHLYGHSKGGDIVQEVTWLRHREPRLARAIALGVPIWSAVNPDMDGLWKRGGLFHLGQYGNRDYAGKLVLFNRYSDRIVHGDLLPPTGLPGPGHDYANILREPAFVALLERAATEAVGWSDRALGRTFDH
jgi:hypothetical protein